MDILFDKAKIDLPKLRKDVHRITSSELAKLVEPCYYPELKKYYFEFLNTCKLSEKDIKEFVKRFWEGRPERAWLLHKDPIMMFYIFIMWIFIKERDTIAYKSMIALIGIRYYTNLINKQIKFCNEKIFKAAIENLAKTHLFAREKSIPAAIFYLSKEMDKRWGSNIRSQDRDGISKFITEYRTRISQSVKKFAETYYRLHKEGISIVEPYEGEENEYQYQQLERSARIVDQVVKNITVYKNVDKKAMNDARTLTRISASLATMLANETTNIRYSDDIKTILELFVRDLKDVNSICGAGFIKYVRSLMATRKEQQVNFKQQVNILILKMIKNLNYESQYKKISKQTQALVNLFMAYFITMSMKNILCH